MEPLTEEVKVKLREEEARLSKLIEALAALDSSKEWHVLKELVFDKSLEAIERQLLNEATKPTIDTGNLYRLQGEWAWAKQYADVNRLTSTLKKQLEAIKNKLK